MQFVLVALDNAIISLYSFRIMKLLLICVSAFYSVIALRLFFAWLKILQRDARLSSQQRQLYVRLIIITILWPLIVPFAYLELLSKAENESADETDAAFESSTNSKVVCQFGRASPNVLHNLRLSNKE